MRTVVAYSIALAAGVLACVNTPQTGPLAEGSALRPRITAVDTAVPPRSAWVDLDQPGYVTLLLVAPGHSATLLYPPDSTFDNRLSAGSHQLTFHVPDVLVVVDSIRNPDRRQPPRNDTMRVGGRRQRSDTARSRMMSISPTTPTYLLLVTSPQPLVYQRVIEKTAGVSIPIVEDEALNAVAKAVKSTITVEPRDWAGYFQRVELRRRK